jgi:hypothetical protein
MSDKIVITYNRTHNVDPSIAPWICKSKGVSHYVLHVTIAPGLGFSTKETPEHASTKAAIVVKGTLTITDGEAIIN